MQAKKIAKMITDLLKEQKKMDLLPEVVKELQKAHTNNNAVVIQSAHTLSHETQDSLTQIIESRLGYKPEIIFEIKPDLIAGIKIQINDQLIDATIKNKLEEVFRKIH